MNHKNYYVTAGCIFGIVSLAHLVRAALAVSIVVGGWTVPVWLSWIGFIVAGFLSYVSFRFASAK